VVQPAAWGGAMNNKAEYYNRKLMTLAAVCILLLLCSGCSEIVSQKSWQYMDTAMGTVIRQSIYCGQEETARAFCEKGMALLNDLEEERLSWRLESSEVYRVNASAGSEEGCILSEELAGLLGKCLEITEASEGAFDVTLGALVRVWNIDQWAAGGQSEEGQLPSPEAIEQSLRLCGSQKLLFAEEGQALLLLPEGMRLDFGAVGKGFALTELLGLLEGERDISGAVIAVGGSVLTYGAKPDGSDWKVGITNPFYPSAKAGILSLEGQWCISTSGDYERYVEVDGVRYHHILDPFTGYPAQSGVRSVTILSKDGMLSDALSTACFILGPERGTGLAEAFGAEALFILEDGEIILSEGMKEYWTYSSKNLAVAPFEQ